MNDLDYIFAVARIRVMEKDLLTDGDIRQMASLPDAEAVLEFLTAKGWGEGVPEKTAETVLTAEENRNTELLTELQVDPSFLEALSLPQQFHNLKAGIQELITSESHENAFYPLPDFDRARVMEILEKRDFGALPSSMQEVAREALEVMLKTRDAQRLHTIVDKGCLAAMEAEADQTKDALLKEYLHLLVALSDIKIAVRGLMMHKSLAFLQEALADSALLSSRRLALAASRSREELFAYLETAGFQDALEAIETSLPAFEVWCDNRLMALIRSQRSVTESSGPVLAYYLARQNEIKTARIILTAKANGFSEEETLERVRVMYV